MLARLPGRETDTTAMRAAGPVALGWRGRVFGEEATVGSSPAFDAAPGLAIAASARLDGEAALCDALGLRPDRRALPDSALILRAYARWGRACPEHLLGDFAFALWDAKRGSLFCARDHAGVRPFFYAHTPERFVFASSLDAVLAAPGVSADLDETAVATKLTSGAHPLGARTWYRSVRRLPPGHSLTVERGTARLDRWWRPEDVPPLPAASDAALAEECRAILSEAVRDRVRDTRRVGVHLSGGLDSSAVAVLAARELRRQGRAAPLALAWQPPAGPDFRSAAERAEYGRIEAVRRQEGLRVDYRAPEAGDVVDFLRRDGARNDAEALMQEEPVQRAAADQGVEVLLSGWGGDEGISFNGRGYYRQLARSGQIVKLWGELRERRQPLAARVGAVLRLASPRVAVVARRRRPGTRSSRNVSFIHPEFARRVRPLPAQARPPRSGVRNVQVHLLQTGHLSRRMEGWAAAGARHGIEYRYPLLDRRVLEFALGLPPEQYRRGRERRWLMRWALDPILPPEVCWNPSKEESAGLAQLGDAVAEALPTVRRMIESLDAPPSRGRYLDMPRLMEHLDPERWRASGRFMPVLNALRFLDF